MLCWAITSRPIVGSSRNSTSGEWSRAAISSIFIRSPSESSRTGWLSSRRTSSRSTSSSCVLLKARRVDAVDLLMEAERLGGGQVPPELILLAHHEREAAAIGVLALPGHEAQHPRLAARGIDHAGEQLERRGFAGAVGTEEGDELARLDVEIDAADGLDLAILAVERARERPPTGLPAFGRRGRTSRGCEFR